MQPAARVGDAIAHGGAIVSGSGNVTINGSSAAFIGSATPCALHGGSAVVSGSGSVSINGSPAARLGDATGCGAVVCSGSGDVSRG